jgi:hypothetical protein
MDAQPASPPPISRNPPPVPPPSDLPAKVTETDTVTVKLPNVLKSVEPHNGRDVLNVITGGGIQADVLTEYWYSETEVASPTLWRVQAQNRIAFAGQNIDVINDAITYGGKTLAPSNPTASDYFAQVGKQVFLHFRCEPVKKGTVIDQTYKRKTLFKISQTSMVLP